MKYSNKRTGKLQLQVNGEVKEVRDGIDLSELISELSIAPERIAVELNQHVVSRADWPGKLLADGDRIEIVHFVGGGR